MIKTIAVGITTKDNKHIHKIFKIQDKNYEQFYEQLIQEGIDPDDAHEIINLYIFKQKIKER